MASTTNYNLGKPEEGTIGWDSVANANMDIINNKIAEILAKQRQAEAAMATVAAPNPIYRGYNMGVHFWRRGVAFNQTNDDQFCADQWFLEGSSGTFSLTREPGSSTDDHRYFGQIAFTASGGADFVNFMPYKPAHSDFFKYCAGRAVTFAVDLQKNGASPTIGITIDDGPSSATTVFQTSTSQWDRIVVNHTVHASPTTLKCIIKCTATATGQTVKFKNAAFSLGTHTTLPYRASNEQEDFLGCCAQYLDIEFVMGWANRTDDVFAKRYLQYPAAMIGLPTATISGGSDTAGSFTSFDFVPVNNLIGYFDIQGNTTTSNAVAKENASLTLEVV